jgi:hypothetical protein
MPLLVGFGFCALFPAASLFVKGIVYGDLRYERISNLTKTVASSTLLVPSIFGENISEKSSILHVLFETASGK